MLWYRQEAAQALVRYRDPIRKAVNPGPQRHAFTG